MSQTLEVPALGRTRLVNKVPIPDSLTVTEDDSKPAKGMGMFRILTIEDGDKRVIWNSQRLVEIRDALKLFSDLLVQGMVPHRIGADGKPAGIMQEFDPEAEEVLFVPMQYAAAG